MREMRAFRLAPSSLPLRTISERLAPVPRDSRNQLNQHFWSVRSLLGRDITWAGAMSFSALSNTVGAERGETKEREVTGQEPKIDFENIPAPAEGILVTQFLIVREVARSRAFYAEVLGGQVVIEENPCIVKLANSWIIMNPGGGPTPDKPGISVVPYEASDEVSSFLNLRVADIEACYQDWKAKGADFVTEPIDRGAEVRCYMRDPDGYLIEVGQATGMLEGKLAKKRAEDLPG
jgi:catechol 2,3-dioxygenase-like lactoylglutathione lyase family enzyme